jgi:polar amino acid transport system substrate-binding protein
MIQYTVNAGAVPDDHWIQDPEVGGGRIIGEVCHFIDFCLYLTGSAPKETKTTILGEPNRTSCSDNVNITIQFENGSVANILYTSAGAKSYPKETVTVFCNSKVGTLDNFTKANVFSEKGKRTMRKANQEKGFKEEYVHISNTLMSRGFVEKTKPFYNLYLITKNSIGARND